MPNVQRLSQFHEIVENGIQTKKPCAALNWTTCVFGWCVDDGRFTKDGLFAHADRDGAPGYREYRSMGALERFFDISSEQRKALFGLGVTPARVLQTIDRMLATKKTSNPDLTEPPIGT